MSGFMMQGGFESVVASSRARLARNIRGYTYGQQPPEKREEIARRVYAVICGVPAIASEFSLHEVRPDTLETARMVEQHWISPALAQRGGWVIVSKDGGASIMVGEEDHLRIQVMGRGLCPKECQEEAQRLAGLIEASIPLDYDEKLGYLTACPTNLGTGLRVSVMAHLPMLTATGQMQGVTGWAGRQGCAVRGAFGEGTRAEGYFYQISNQVTLGMSEQALTGRLLEVVTRVLETEEKARQAVRERDETGLADRLCRAAGVLKTARRMDTQEAERCLSDVLMGLQMGFLGGVTAAQVCDAERSVRPASLTAEAGGALSPAERDTARARKLRQTVGERLTIL